MSDKNTGGGRTPNDQRADVKNPNNSDYVEDQINRDSQAAEKEDK
ncbi:MAG: hypothetical protein P9L92_17710 [Candidatus Electryonea clarkiae]|nr:hypothetical protein [Candidatus Electryonea clarkiae]MDP8286834.1 hypothetical protein [Candidatus Electryonea clarkiae]